MGCHHTARSGQKLDASGREAERPGERGRAACEGERQSPEQRKNEAATDEGLGRPMIVARASPAVEQSAATVLCFPLRKQGKKKKLDGEEEEGEKRRETEGNKLRAPDRVILTP